jgi:hypothetical protein
MLPCTITLRCAHNNLQDVILQDTESSDNTNMKTSNITTLNFHLNYSLISPLSSKWHCQHTVLYTVMLEERSVFLGLTVLVIIRRKVHINMCLIVNGYWDRAVWMYRPNCVRFWFMVLDEEQSLQTKGGYMRRTVCYNFGSAACIQQHEVQLRRTTHNICTQTVKCTEGDGGLSEHLLWTVINLLFMCNKLLI